MKLVKVEGKNKSHKVKMYALSTCIHCRAAKQFLRESDVEFEYVDVDLCDEKDFEEIKKDILKRGSGFAFPQIIIDDKTTITGLDKKKIKETLKIP